MGFTVRDELHMVVQTKELLQVEDLLDVEKDLDKPILTELPVAEIFFQLQFARISINQRMMHFGLERDFGHGLGIRGRNLDHELQDSILVNALLDEIDTFPPGELRRGIIRRKRICWHKVDANWRVLLQQLVLQVQRLQANSGHNRVRLPVSHVILFHRHRLGDVGHFIVICLHAVEGEWIDPALLQVELGLRLLWKHHTWLRALTKLSRS